MALLVRVANTGLLGSVMRDCASVQEEPSEEDTDIKILIVRETSSDRESIPDRLGERPDS